MAGFRQAQLRCSSLISRARPGCLSNSASSTPSCSPSYGASCEPSFRTPVDARLIHRAIASSSPSRVLPTPWQAAVAVQRALATLPIRGNPGTRPGAGFGAGHAHRYHTGEPRCSGEGYVGIDVNRAARLTDTAHGGQVLLSQSAAALSPTHSLQASRCVTCTSTGSRNLPRPSTSTRCVSLASNRLPPLKPRRTIECLANKPAAQTTTCIGRDPDVQAIRHLLTP